MTRSVVCFLSLIVCFGIVTYPQVSRNRQLLTADTLPGNTWTPDERPVVSATPPGNPCTPDEAAVVSATALSGSKVLSPNVTVVGKGMLVQLRGTAYVVTGNRDCEDTFIPMDDLDWSMVFQPRGNDSLFSATQQLGNPQSLSTSFTATSLGVYQVTFQARLTRGVRPPLVANPVTLSVEVVDAPIGWVNLGPDGTQNKSTGRINALAIDPRNGTLYAGSALGGVWKSTNGGTSWTPMSDNKRVPTLAIGALAVAPDGAVYAGTGDPYKDTPGRGVYVSTDGGVSWNSSFICGDDTGRPMRPLSGKVYRILVDQSSNPSIAYMAGDAGILRREPATPNGCWTRILTPSNLRTSAPATDIALDLSDPSGNTLYAAVPGAGILRTTNARSVSVSWNEYLDNRGDPLQLSGARSDIIKLAIASNGLLYAAFGRGGSQLQVWRMRPGIPLGSGINRGTLMDTSRYMENGQLKNDLITGWGNPLSYNLVIAVNPANPNDLFLATVPTWRSTNGSLFVNQSGSGFYATHGDVHDLLFDPRNPSFLYQADDGGVFRTDVRISPLMWTTRNTNLNVAQFYTIATSPSRVGALAGGLQDNASQQHFPNTGRRWSVLPNAGGDGSSAAYDAADPSLIFFHDNIFSDNAFYSTKSLYPPNPPCARVFWSDPLIAGVLLGAINPCNPCNTLSNPPCSADLQLFISFGSNRTVSNQAVQPSWACIDPTPSNPNDKVTTIAVSRDTTARANGPAYLVGLSRPVTGGSNVGEIWLVQVQGQPVGNATPSCASSSSTATKLYDSSGAANGVTSINSVVEDPFTPGVVWAATNSTNSAWRVLRLGNSANNYNQPMIAQPVGGVPGRIISSPWFGAQALTVLADPSVPGIVYVGTDRGLFIGQYQGSRPRQWIWTQDENFPTTTISSLQLGENSQGVKGSVYAATFGRGVWQRIYTPPTSPVNVTTAIENDVTIQHCQVRMLGEQDSAAGRLALVEVDYTKSDPQSTISIRPTVVSHGQEQPYFIREVKTLEAGKGSVQLLLHYAATSSPLGIRGDGIRLDFLDAGHQVIKHESFDINTTWLRADAVLLRVESLINRQETGSTPISTEVSVSGGGEPAQQHTTPFELIVKKESRIVLIQNSSAHGAKFVGWYVNEEAAGIHNLTLTMNKDRSVQIYFHEAQPVDKTRRHLR